MSGAVAHEIFAEKEGLRTTQHGIEEGPKAPSAPVAVAVCSAQIFGPVAVKEDCCCRFRGSFASCPVASFTPLVILYVLHMRLPRPRCFLGVTWSGLLWCSLCKRTFDNRQRKQCENAPPPATCVEIA